VTGAARVVIAVEENKPEAATALQGAVQGTGFQVLRMATKYPMGGEKSLLRAALGRVVPTGGLPLDVGTVVVNVGTSAAIALAVLRGRPLTHRIVTVTGPGVAVPKNLLVPIGVSIRALLDHCGGLTPAATLVLAGGPMMGLTIPSLDTPITKGASGVTVLTAREVGERQETSCVRCGRCVDVCPLNLVPTRLALASRNRDWEAAKRHHLMACMECGCCAFACPARIPLVQLIRVGKASLPKG
jgi:electron transport complex protein RnfC